MLVSLETVLYIIMGIVSIFGFIVLIQQDKIVHLRELMRLRMTEGGQVRVTFEEQAAIEMTLRNSNLGYLGGTHDYRKARTA